MRLYQYINENSLDTSEIVSILIKDCRPFLKEFIKFPKDGFLYRGIKSESYRENIIKKRSRMSNRKPVDTPLNLHNALNDAFEDEFGWKVRNGISVTSNRGTASGYGVSYIFFPMGNYKYVYHPNIKDLTTKMYSKKLISTILDNKINYENISKLVKEYTDKDIKSVFNNEPEIMFNCKEYYLVDKSMKFILKKKIKERL